MDVKDQIAKYLYFKQHRLSNDYAIAAERSFRMNLDSVQLLEEIIANERLNLFYEIEREVLEIINSISQN